MNGIGTLHAQLPVIGRVEAKPVGISYHVNVKSKLQLSIVGVDLSSQFRTSQMFFR